MNEDSDIEIPEYDRGNPLAAELETPNFYRQAALKAHRFYLRGFAYVYKHRENLALTFDCFLLAIEQYDLIGVDNQVALASRHNVTKASVSKIVKQIQRRIDLKPSPNQRKPEGCKNMRRTRKEQLK